MTNRSKNQHKVGQYCLDNDHLNHKEAQISIKKKQSIFFFQSNVHTFIFLTSFSTGIFLVSVEPSHLCMTISSKKTRNLLKRYSSLFYFAKHIYASRNGNFLAIDYSIGNTEIWMIKYKSGLPYMQLTRKR